jgi:hypothetical protein
MHWIVFDSCMHSFFALTDVGQVAHPTACLGALVEPVCRGGRTGLPLTIGSPGLPLYLPYIYIVYCILYIRSTELPITRGPGQTVQFGRARQGPHVYKRKSVVLGFSFHALSRFISDGTCDDGGCPIARAAVDPQPVAAAPRPRRAVAAVPRSRVEAAVPRSAAAAPRSRGRATAVPLCGQAAAFPGPRGGSTSTTSDTRGVRLERRHGRCEVRAATIAHDILRSSAIRAAPMTTYICAYVVDDVLRRLPPSIRVFFSIIVFYIYHMYYLC